MPHLRSGQTSRGHRLRAHLPARRFRLPSRVRGGSSLRCDASTEVLSRPQTGSTLTGTAHGHQIARGRQDAVHPDVAASTRRGAGWFSGATTRACLWQRQAQSGMSRSAVPRQLNATASCGVARRHGARAASTSWTKVSTRPPQLAFVHFPVPWSGLTASRWAQSRRRKASEEKTRSS